MGNAPPAQALAHAPSMSETERTRTTNRGQVTDGTPQGGSSRRCWPCVHASLSPAWRERGMARHLKATVVSYADDLSSCVGHRGRRARRHASVDASAKADVEREENARVRCDADAVRLSQLHLVPRARPTGRPISRCTVAEGHSSFARARANDTASRQSGSVARRGAPSQPSSCWHRYFSYRTVSSVLGLTNSCSIARVAFWHVAQIPRRGRSASQRMALR